MAIFAPGSRTVPIPGTPVKVVVNPDKTSCHTIVIQALATNGGRIYIGNSSSMNKVTLSGVIYVLAAPVPGQPLADWRGSMPHAPSAFPMENLYIDVEAPDDGVLVHYWR